MTRTLILTPNKNLQCGMYQLAQDLAKEFDGDIKTLKYNNSIYKLYPFMDKFDVHLKIDKFNVEKQYDDVITLFYPMHLFGRSLKEAGLKWICYDQGIPPITKTYFPNFWRRQYMKIFNKLDTWSMKGADEYWDVTEREQKSRWDEKSKLGVKIIHSVLGESDEPYAIYLGRTTDYKNFDWLKSIMEEFGIALVHPQNMNDNEIWQLLSNAKMLVTASLWEGYGRGVSESEYLGVPAVAYDVGTHRRHIKKGICVPLDINNMKQSEEDFKEAILEVWNR